MGALAAAFGFGKGRELGQDMLLLAFFWGKEAKKARQKAGKIVVGLGPPPRVQHCHPLALGDDAKAGQLGEEEIPREGGGW